VRRRTRLNNAVRTHEDPDRYTLWCSPDVECGSAGLWSPVATFLAVDGCLDAGGSFNYASHECDFESSHPYAPENDSARLRWALAIALAGVAVTIVGRYRRR
jgi:hypothetical protein